MSAFIPWRTLVPRKLTFAPPDEEIFYSKKGNIDSLRLIDVSMVSHYFTKGDIEGCKKTVREFWDNVEKNVITPQQCVLIDKKCFALLKAIIDTFKRSAQNLTAKYAIVDVKKMQDQLDYIRASVTGMLYFEMDDIDLSLHDYFILRCHILGLVFINHILRLHVKLAISDVKSAQFADTSRPVLPSTKDMEKSLLSSTPVEDLIENQWVLGPVNARNFTLQYPTFSRMDLHKMEERLQKTAAAWKKFNETNGG